MSWKLRAKKFKSKLNEEEVIRLYLACHNAKEVARQLGVSNTTILYILEKHGITRHRFKHPVMRNNIPEKDLIYFAGLFDGEGSLVTQRRKRWKKETLEVRLSVYNTSKDIMSWLVSRFGGGITISDPKGKQIAGYTSKKNVYAWAKYPLLEVGKILKLILPYLVIKRDKVSMVINEIEEYVGFSL